MAESKPNTSVAVARIKTLRSSNAGTLTKQVNRSQKALLDHRSRATLRDCIENINSALEVLIGTNDIYSLSLEEEDQKRKCAEWMSKYEENAAAAIASLEERLTSADLHSVTTADYEVDLDRGEALLTLQPRHVLSGPDVKVSEWLTQSTTTTAAPVVTDSNEYPTTTSASDVTKGDECRTTHAAPVVTTRYESTTTIANYMPVTTALSLASTSSTMIYTSASSPSMQYYVKTPAVPPAASFDAGRYVSRTQPTIPCTSSVLFRLPSSNLNPTAHSWTPHHNTRSIPNPRPPALDAWIDDLVSGQESIVPQPMHYGSREDHLFSALVNMEGDRSLPSSQIPVFDGTALLWPKFVEMFYTLVHCHPGINDTRRMDILQQHVTGDALLMIKGIGYSGRCYADAWKELKRTFGHKNQVARAFTARITKSGTIPSNNSVALRSFYVDIRDCILTLEQLQCTSDLQGPGLLLRVARRLPVDKVRHWNRRVSHISEIREPTLIDLRDWLRENLDVDFNPYAVKLDPGKRDKSNAGRDVVNYSISKPYSKDKFNTKDKLNSEERSCNDSEATHNTKTSNQKGNINTNCNRKDRNQKSKYTIECPLCKESHHLYRCFRFINKKPQDRLDVVKTNQLCRNCLRKFHLAKDCKSELSCREIDCKEKHHTLLHYSLVKSASMGLGSKTLSDGQSCFPLVKVFVSGSNGRWISTVALLDTASQISCIHQALATELGLKGQPKQLKLRTMNANSVTQSQIVSFRMKSTDSAAEESMPVNEAWTVSDGAIRCSSLCIADEWKHCQGLGLEDIDAKDVKILIGINVPTAHLQLETRIGTPDQPVAIRTALGWTLLGTMEDADLAEAEVNLITIEQDLGRQLEKFWTTESFGTRYVDQDPMSIEDKKAMKILENTTRLVDGHYEIGMLWKDSCTSLPDNKHVALRRYHLLEKRLRKHDEMRRLYSETVNGYVAKGFARKLTPEEAKKSSPRTWYLPHHGVLNPNKPGKIRVVFDAAATYQGTSLNENLMTGPDLLNSLFGVIQRFRLHAVAVTADIEGMFHQVRVPKDDIDALRFLWKEDVDKPGLPDVYVMESHIFGAADSPTIANYALKRSALDNQDDFDPSIVQAVLNDFYVDDLDRSFDTVKQAIDFANGVVVLLSRGGFRLHKFISNNAEFLSHIEESERTIKELNFGEDDPGTLRTLGLKWMIRSDEFVFDIRPKDNPATKRGVVSTVSQIFDPCGYLAPFTVRGKFIIQELWKSNLEWDETLEDKLLKTWKSWLVELEDLKMFRLPRHHQWFTSQVVHIELHLFSDASQIAFGAVGYIRYTAADGLIRCSLLGSRTRVAPLKPALSIPRLELQGAVMAARFGNMLIKELGLGISDVTYWTDSTTVLRYLQNETKRFKTFVAHRVAEILELTDAAQWRYVPTKSNPADSCSRGLKANTLLEDCQWFEGPAFLKQNPSTWPSMKKEESSALDHDPEIKKSSDSPKACNVILNGSATTEIQLPLDVTRLLNLPEYSTVVNTAKAATEAVSGSSILDVTSLIDSSVYSSWEKLVRRTAWLNRSIQNFCSPIKRLGMSAVTKPSITAAEYHEAGLIWIRKAQEDAFSEELAVLRANKEIDTKSKLVQLSPYFDKNSGCLRVGGRLRKANIPVSAKYQLILPASHTVTLLLFNSYHKAYAHCGREQLLAMMRQRYWPVRGRVLAKKTITNCLYCHRRRVRPVVPRMADLPEFRLSVDAGPFYHSGVDYFGPMYTCDRRSTLKRWGCLFTCLGTRAVHLELADSLDTDDFILCLRRFIGRRGEPKTISSDCGSNFCGANAELQRCLANLQQTKIQEFLSPLGVEWYFNPPASPHMGGVWESLVKSVKTALQAVLPKQKLKDSVLRTALVEVEAVVNSRPLTHNSSDPNDLTALTPNHFLIGRAVITCPPDLVADREINSRKRWRQVQVVADHVNKRWRQEYLPNLTTRRKWWKEERNIAVGDLVTVHDENLPRGKWTMARVIDTYPGDDGKVRSVLLKTATSTYVRPASKVCMLEETLVN